MNFITFLITVDTLLWVFYDSKDVLRYIEREGGQEIFRSFLLDGSVVRMDRSLVDLVKGMKGVEYILPVRRLRGVYNFDTYRLHLNSQMKFDSSFYGYFYKQNKALGVPETHEMGYNGSGIRIGFLDSGLKRLNAGLKYINLIDEHDFLAGDVIVVDTLEFNTYGPVLDLNIYEDAEGELWISYITDTVISGSVYRGFFVYSTVYGFIGTGSSFLDVKRAGMAKGKAFFVERYNRYSPSPYSTIELLLRDSTSFVTLKKFTGRYGGIGIVDDTIFFVYQSTDGNLVLSKVPLVDTDTFFLKAFETSTNHIKNVIDDRGYIYSLEMDTLLIFDREMNLIHRMSPIQDIFRTDEGILLLRNDSLYLYDCTSDRTTYIDHDVWTACGVKRDDGYRLSVLKDDSLKVLSLKDGRLSVSQSFENHFLYSPVVSENKVAYVLRGDDNTDYEEGEDDPSQPFHGTMMVSIVASYSPWTAVGIAPSSEIVMAKTERVTRRGENYEWEVEEYEWVEGLEWLIKKGCRIISSSLAYRDWYSYEDMDGMTAITSRAAGRAAQMGVIIVNAMGNIEDTDRPDTTIMAPADAYGVVSVGGVDVDDLSPWSRSAQGPTSDGRMKPEVVAPASGVFTLNPDVNHGVVQSAGTSNATAMVSGLFALLAQAHPDWSSDKLKEVLFKTSSQYDHPDNIMGYGIPNIEKAIKYEPDYVEPERTRILPPFPNPAEDRVYIPFVFIYPEWVNLYLVNLKGEVVKEKQLNNGNKITPGRYTDRKELEEIGAYFDVSELSPGLYYIVMRTSTFVLRKPFVKVR